MQRLTFRAIRTIITSFPASRLQLYMTGLNGVLTREDIIELLHKKPPLVEETVAIDEQLQPNGLDLTVREVGAFSSRGNLTETNDGRVLSKVTPLIFDDHGGIDMLPGAYLVTFNEIVNLPRNVMALGRPRSTLNRCGISMHSAVWDAGYSGRSQSLLVVYNAHGFRLHRNARILQLVFFRLSRGVAQGYRGKYQQENITQIV
ncbi:MAG: deoxyuridine 5'-triphosphate nucleotidohydrolase [Dehalococcoidia bacterium]|nr:deoxyuridine 5'-triphosphate nucleotidohydrolase [Dehalococcoidia bacterium]